MTEAVRNFQSVFSLKRRLVPRISRSVRSKVVFKASCWDCDDFYIGKTKRWLHDRQTNTSKRWRVTAILLPLLIIGPKQATGLKGHFELIESSSVIIQKSDFQLEKETHWLFEVKYYDYITFFSLRTMKHELLCKLPMFLQLNSSQFITSLCQRSREKIKGNLKKITCCYPLQALNSIYSLLADDYCLPVVRGETTVPY